ncbi:hypothetical protein SEPCBS57363_002206 [Sporothrix epigloea]|uniref:Non-homologous end-joining factor 1 n=1 Tax=Sporothrix epigloea TaxID=1892477 RepID=A0ABP0DG72_9PEZI
MNIVRAWRTLPATHPDVPGLLVATEFGPASYAIYVTDLAHIWAERLERRDICMRAFQENTTIDPSYNNEQMSVFLGKLRVALLDSSDADASLSLAAAANGNLVLHTTTILPAGLKPLRWPMYLQKQSSTAITSELVLPLIHDRTMLQRTTSHLVAAIREKDAVINKLVDKLDAMGAGVESAFPTLVGAAGSSGGGSSRRKITRADMERRVRGLAAFDEADFQKRINSVLGSDGAIDTEAETAKLLSDAFDGGNELRYDAETFSGATMSPKLHNWWQELGSGRGVLLKRSMTNTRESSQSTIEAKDIEATMEQDGDNAFQEPTPKRPPPVKAPSPAHKTDPPSPTPIKPKSKVGASKMGRLGAIGKKPTATTLPPTSPSMAAKKMDEDNDTASEADELPHTPKGAIRSAPNAAVVHSRPKAASGGLGHIGGKNKQTSASTPPRANLDPFGQGKTAAGGKEREPDGENNGDKQSAPQSKEKVAPRAAALVSSPNVDVSKRAEAIQKAIQKHAAPMRKKRKF